MQIKRVVAFIAVYFLILKPLYSQDFDWLKAYGTISGATVKAVSADTSGGCTALLICYGTTTIYFDTINFLNPSGTYLVKHDKNGKVTNAYKVNSNTLFARDICRDDSGNIYLTGDFTGTSGVINIGSLSLSVTNGGLIFAKFDKSFNFVWATQTGNSSTGATRIIHSGGRMYFVCGSSTSPTIGTITYNFGNGFTYVFGELNSANGMIKWSNYIYKASNNPATTVQLYITDLLTLRGKLYISGRSSGGLRIGTDTIYGPSGYVARTDSLGRYEDRFNFWSKKITTLYGMATDGEYLYIGGGFSDSLHWGNKVLAPQYGTGSLFPELYAASITTNLQPRWIFRPKILDKSRGQKNLIEKVVSSNGYFYFGGTLDSKILIDSNILNPKTSDIFIFKADYLGNILWATKGGGKSSRLYTMDVNSGKYIFAGGAFADTITLGKYSKIANGPGNGFVTKISNYFINRGQVKSGPYCAGDTIKIPYTKYGNFDSSNTFIAQLSDEYGNFESGYRELGRLKTNQDGVIKGTLPLFQVASSKLYRIRILSTKPPVQSYYRIDTLRLLIYSRDKANPGPPDTICRGDTIQLSTYGGTKWNWSPTNRMDNSKARQPKVWPEVSTTYRIIIGDSSGCGQIDTGYKQIIVRKSPKAFLDFIDTVVCSNYQLSIPANFRFGDSTHYSWKWFLVNSPSSFFMLKSANSVVTDTLTYTPSVEINKSEKLVVVLKDGCSNKSDTAYLTIGLREPVTITSKFRDTTICYGNSLSFIAAAKGGLKQNYTYQWIDLLTNTKLSDKDFLNFAPKQTTKVQLTLNDGCPNLADTAMFEVNVKPPLQVNALTTNGSLNDTTLCFGQTLKLNSNAKGGIGTGYNFKWFLKGKLISNADTLLISTTNLFSPNGETQTLILTLSDNCTKFADSIKKAINVIPGPQADFTYGKACSKSKTQFTFTGSIAATPVLTNYSWRFPDKDSSLLQNPLKLLNQSGKNKVTLTLKSNNGCKDEITKDVDVKQQAKADFEVTDVCEDSAANFINKSIDGLNFNWKFGDGNTSTIISPRHKYNIAGVTKTFNVTLVAIVPNGCSDSITEAITVNANPNSDFSFTINGKQVNFTATQTNATQYQWNFGDGGTQSTASPIIKYSYTQSQKYTACLKVTNTANCNSETCKEIAITGGITNPTQQREIKIYPNPNEGSFTVDIAEPYKNTKVEIFNLIGQVIYITELHQSSNTLNLNIADGLYQIRITHGGGSFYQNLLINHVR